jgi:hypothetical protein
MLQAARVSNLKFTTPLQPFVSLMKQQAVYFAAKE